jgi:vacuolar-type H+-ATPase subunit H
MRARQARDHKASQDDALARLLAAERNLALRLAAAKEEAEEIVQRAREDAQRIEQACEATIAANVAALTAQHSSQLEHELARISREARDNTARFSNIDQARVQGCVELVIARLLPTADAESSR